MSLSVFLFFAVLFVLAFAMRAARVGTLVAFLFAGILSGPHIMNLFQLTDTWHFLGNLGIIFLWFNIGLQINLKRLWQMKRTIFGFGAAQVLMVAIMLFPILSVLTHWSIMGAVMVALLLAMSSTSADLQLLADRDELNTTPGRQAFSILLFQDLLSIPLLAMLPVFAGHTFNLGATVIDITVLSLGLILGVALVSRVILNPLLRLVSKLKSKEVFLITIMLIIAGGAVALDALGLPAGLGAFLAGMLMSETIYNHQVGVEITPYSTLFLALFFIALGMELNLPFLMERWYWVLIGLCGLIAVKFMAIYIVARVRGVENYDAARVALILAQGGEFGLLMLQTMRQGGISAIPAAHEEILVAIIILSIIATPLLMAVYDWVMRHGKFITSRYPRCLADVSPDGVPTVFICGFGRVGQIVARMLDAQGISYIALDLNVHSVMLGREQGCNVAYGDTRNPDVLKCFGLSPRRTRAVVVALDNATTARD
ncbi:hypothetical protein HDR66_02830, partial [bacterium]|nr:hypothetical protein [bacterium]